MIKSAIQLKAKVRNYSGGDDRVSKALIRVFFMERFLERISISKYKEQFILKGGMLVASILGVNLRATMDIDTTVKALPLNGLDIEKIILEICGIQLNDNITFRIIKIENIMDEFEYPGVRIHMEGLLDKLRQPIKIDISTDDVITPGTVEYKYPLMFEEQAISLTTYNIETLLAEKSQTIISRGLANTRMRDFYDIYEIVKQKDFSQELYKEAFIATCRKRETEFTYEKIEYELSNISTSNEMRNMWIRFKEKNYFVEDIEYDEMMAQICSVILSVLKN